MARERICQYGNCHSYDIRVTVNIVGDERPAFCSAEHAGLYLLQRALRLTPVGTQEAKQVELRRLVRPWT